MATADELEKLVALKDKGALSKEEFDQAKRDLLSAPKAKSALAAAAKGFLAIALISIAGSIWYYNVSTDGTGIPACASGESTQTLQRAFDGSQFAKTLNVSIVEVSDAKEIRYDEGKKARFCSARIRLNNTSQLFATFDMEKRESGGFLLQFKVADESATSPPPPRPNGATPNAIAETQAPQLPTISNSPKPSISNSPQTVFMLVQNDRPQYIDPKTIKLYGDDGLLGKTPAEVIQSPQVKLQFEKLLGSEFGNVLERLSLARLALEGDFLVGAGIAPHGGGSDEAIFGIDVKTGKVVAIMLESDAKASKTWLKMFGENSPDLLAPPLRTWFRDRY